MATLTLTEPNVADSALDGGNTSTNYGSGTGPLTIGWVVFKGSAPVRWVAVFDISAIPAGSIISSATLTIANTSMPGHTMRCHELDRTDWVEGEVTWNEWSSGNSWSTPGGDFAAAYQEVTFPSGGDVVFDELASVGQRALDVRSGLFSVLVKHPTESGPSIETFTAHFKEHATEESSSLVVNYWPPLVCVKGNDAKIWTAKGTDAALWKAVGSDHSC